MNCHNCGAPMTLFPDRGYFFCEHCGSFHFPESTGEGVRLLDQVEAGLLCPVCHQPLLAATLEDGYPAHYCRECRGLLLPRASFRGTLQLRRARAAGPGIPPRALDRAQLERQVSCPACRCPMATHPYLGPGNAVIDTCSACEVIWLDYGELTQLVEAPGGDRGVPLPEPQDPSPEASATGDVLQVRDGQIEINLSNLLGRLFG